jgi:hypothetical protein
MRTPPPSFLFLSHLVPRQHQDWSPFKTARRRRPSPRPRHLSLSLPSATARPPLPPLLLLLLLRLPLLPLPRLLPTPVPIRRRTATVRPQRLTEPCRAITTTTTVQVVTSTASPTHMPRRLVPRTLPPQRSASRRTLTPATRPRPCRHSQATRTGPMQSSGARFHSPACGPSTHPPSKSQLLIYRTNPWA